MCYQLIEASCKTILNRHPYKNYLSHKYDSYNTMARRFKRYGENLIAKVDEYPNGDIDTRGTFTIAKSNTFDARQVLNDDSNFMQLRDVSCEPVLERECDVSVDVAVLLDGSNSISYPSFLSALRFVKELVGVLNITPNKSRVGVMQFSNITNPQKIELYPRTREELNDLLTGIEYMWGDGTFVASAMEDLYEEVWQKRRGNGIHTHVFVITDGVSNDDVRIPADKFKAMDDITVWAIGINEANEQDLRSIATDYDTMDHVFQVRIQDLHEQRQSIQQGLCENHEIRNVYNQQNIDDAKCHDHNSDDPSCNPNEIFNNEIRYKNEEGHKDHYQPHPRYSNTPEKDYSKFIVDPAQGNARVHVNLERDYPVEWCPHKFQSIQREKKILFIMLDLSGIQSKDSGDEMVTALIHFINSIKKIFPDSKYEDPPSNRLEVQILGISYFYNAQDVNPLYPNTLGTLTHITHVDLFSQAVAIIHETFKKIRTESKMKNSYQPEMFRGKMKKMQLTPEVQQDVINNYSQVLQDTDTLLLITTNPEAYMNGEYATIANWYLNQGKNVRTWVAADAKTPEYKALENKETYVGYLQNQYDVVGRRLIFNQVATHLCSMYYPDEFDG